jgi:ornithine cyclodeaminase/alanine dehydrogenase-like protein (mu-crystallin family)|tara:strand:+ start:146 stop:511 length:366 start_codon:yes stop_codon:yes gene_type:complete
MEPTFNIAICGGGNLAHACISSIGYCNPHFKINVLSRRPEVWDKQIVAKTNGTPWAYRGDMIGKINLVSNKGKDVVSDADIILVCSPAHTKNEILMEIRDHVKPGALIGSVFGQGAFDWQA